MIKSKSSSYNLDNSNKNQNFSYTRLKEEATYKKLPNEDGDGEFPSLSDVERIRRQKQEIKSDVAFHNFISHTTPCNDRSCNICRGTGVATKETIEKYKDLKKQQYSGIHKETTKL